MGRLTHPPPGITQYVGGVMDADTCAQFVTLLTYFPTIFGANATLSAVPSFSVCPATGCNLQPVPVSRPAHGV